MLVAGSISLATSFLGSLISIILHGRVLWASSKQLSFSMVLYAFSASALMQVVGKGLPEADERVCLAMNPSCLRAACRCAAFGSVSASHCLDGCAGR
jgi:hypothetical protein